MQRVYRIDFYRFLKNFQYLKLPGCIGFTEDLGFFKIYLTWPEKDIFKWSKVRQAFNFKF
jgi:hypothetical protein